jgi:hypothetical protein
MVFLRLNRLEVSPTEATPAVSVADHPSESEDALGAQVVALVPHTLNAGDFAARLRDRLTPAPAATTKRVREQGD